MAKSKTLFSIIFIALVAGGGVVIWTVVNTPADSEAITSFEECTAAGYPVMESYPRQCKTSDGRTFVEDIPVSKGDFEPVTNCQSDEECMLINEELEYRCCWAGACDAVDYSQDKWIAVNKAWFEEGKAASCPSTQECGPAPLCAVRAINLDFTAQCIDQICQKTPK